MQHGLHKDYISSTPTFSVTWEIKKTVCIGIKKKTKQIAQKMSKVTIFRNCHILMVSAVCFWILMINLSRH